MTNELMSALITGLTTLLGILGGYVINARMTSYKIQELRQDFGELKNRVDKHNNLVERMAVAENSIRSAHHRIDSLE